MFINILDKTSDMTSQELHDETQKILKEINKNQEIPTLHRTVVQIQHKADAQAKHLLALIDIVSWMVQEFNNQNARLNFTEHLQRLKNEIRDDL